MGVTLEPTLRVNGVLIGALSETHVHCKTHKRGGGVFGAKKPLAILLADETGLRAFSPEGEPLDWTQLEATHPEPCKAFTSAAKG